MKDNIGQPFPPPYDSLLKATVASGFTMASEVQTCCLLRTIAGSKPQGKFLELGTGTGLSTAWILDGMDAKSSLESIDNDAALISIAHQHLGSDKRLELITTDGAEWVSKNAGRKFDFIFADTWHGKYLLLDEVLSMLNPGAFYIIDDMLPQPNWPEGHDKKATNLIDYLDSRPDLFILKQCWASGVVVAVKR